MMQGIRLGMSVPFGETQLIVTKIAMEESTEGKRATVILEDPVRFLKEKAETETRRVLAEEQVETHRKIREAIEEQTR